MLQLNIEFLHTHYTGLQTTTYSSKIHIFHVGSNFF